MKSASTELEREAPTRNRNAGRFMRILSIYIVPLVEPTPSNRETEKIRRGGLHPRNRSRCHASALARVDERFANQKNRWVFSRRVLHRRSARPNRLFVCVYVCTRSQSRVKQLVWLGAQCTPTTVYNSSKSPRVNSPRKKPPSSDRIESNRIEPALEYQTIRSNQHVNNSRSVPQKKKRTSHTRVI